MQSTMQKSSNSNPFRWWHGVLFYAGIQTAQWAFRVAARSMLRGRKDQVDQAFYRKEIRPVFAPPAIAFPIAWTINSASSIAGMIHVLNIKRHPEEKARFLVLQTSAWLLFTVFNVAYFELHSPLNAAVITFTYSGLTVASIKSAVRMNDWNAVLSLLPTALWLALANPVAFFVAAWNRDEFWKIGPFIEPAKFLLRDVKDFSKPY